MSRLTWHTANGMWGLTGLEQKELCALPERLYMALCKLKDYEDICESPDKVERMADLLKNGSQ